MYTIIDDNEISKKRILRKDKHETKIFVVNGEIVKFPKSGIVYFPLDTTINVCKMLHFVKHQIDMAINRSTLHHNAIMQVYGIGKHMEIDENAKILASLELIEKY